MSFVQQIATRKCGLSTFPNNVQVVMGAMTPLVGTRLSTLLIEVPHQRQLRRPPLMNVGGGRQCKKQCMLV